MVGRGTFQLVIKTYRATRNPAVSTLHTVAAVSLILSSSSFLPPPSCKLINAPLTRSEVSVRQLGSLVLYPVRREEEQPLGVSDDERLQGSE